MRDFKQEGAYKLLDANKYNLGSGTLMRTKKLACLISVALLAGPLSAMAQQYAVTDLGTLGGTSSWGDAINASGQVTGYAESAGNVGYHAFVYSNSSLQDLDTFGGTYSDGNGINASGQVTSDAYTNGNAADHAFLYSNGNPSGSAHSAARIVKGRVSTRAARSRATRPPRGT